MSDHEYQIKAPSTFRTENVHLEYKIINESKKTLFNFPSYLIFQNYISSKLFSIISFKFK
jgi:hypothetical protein